jgi:isoleucyl-tRNA synthetase
LFGKPAFKNVIVNGIVLAEDGQKMSKKLKNYPDPSYVVNKYSADALRYYLLSSPVVAAEDLAFFEKGLDDVYKKVILRLQNVLSFYEMYPAEKSQITDPQSQNVLDKWIVARLNELGKEVTIRLNAYELDRASRPVLDFIDDLSAWYLRRSRERMKEGGGEAAKTLAFVLLELSKVMAPFTPFIAEDIYKKVGGDKESVHLADWIDFNEFVDQEIIEDMRETRRIVSIALEKRSVVAIKVRQPLSKLEIRPASPELQRGENTKLETKSEYLELIKDEVNVKEIAFNSKLTDEVELDTEITEELKKEGEVREIIRAIQSARKEANLTPDQKVKIKITAPAETIELIKSSQEEISKPTNVSEIELKIENCELKIEVDVS